MPLPFVNKPFRLRQPDGETIAAIGSGNQHFARFTNLEGDQIILKDRAGRFYKVPARGGLPRPEHHPPIAGLPIEQTRWRIRNRQRLRTLRRNHIRRTVSTLGATGNCVALCVLVDFPDEHATIPQGDVDAFCNTPGYAANGNRGSVHDYFDDASAQALDLTTLVTPWYKATHNRSYYESPAAPYPERARELVTEALNHFVGIGFAFGGLTVDGQSCVNAVTVVYAGDETDSYAQGLWGHASHLSSPLPLGSGVFANDYTMVAAGEHLTLGVFCHELGHMLCDFPDLYPYDGIGSGVGDFCLMAHGASFATNPVELSAYLKYRAGWATVTPLTSGPRTAGAGATDFFIHNRTSSEYFLLENRRRAVYDGSLPTEGLALWRVDESGDNTHAHPPVGREECMLVEADGGTQLQTGVSTGDPGDLFGAGFTTQVSGALNPNANWQDGSPSNLALTDISAPAATMTFTVS